MGEGASGLHFPPAVSCCLHHTFVKTSLSSPWNPEPRHHSSFSCCLASCVCTSLFFTVFCPSFTDIVPCACWFGLWPPVSLPAYWSSVSQFSWHAVCLLPSPWPCFCASGSAHVSLPAVAPTLPYLLVLADCMCAHMHAFNVLQAFLKP